MDAEWALYSHLLYPTLIDEKLNSPDIITINMNIEPWAEIAFEGIASHSNERNFLQSYVDISFSYHPNSSILATYYDRTRYPIHDFSLKTPKSFAQRKKGACVFVSNCLWAPLRTKYIEELQNYYPIRSFGKCFHNENTTRSKIDELSECKYSISFESHHLPYYVTEKLLESLKARTLSIYWGAPNIQQILPLETLPVINANDISPKQLGEILHRLDQNPSEYIKYFERNTPTQEQIQKINHFRYNSYDNKICSLCVSVAEMKYARNILKKMGIVPRQGLFKVPKSTILNYIQENNFNSKETQILLDIYDHAYARLWKNGNENNSWNDPKYCKN